jgi:hypothetical protein
VRTAAALAAWLILSTPQALRAQSSAPASEDVEAAYLYQFGRYVEWPPELVNDSKTFDICVLGMDPLGGADFTRRGGMIGFTSEDRRVRFVVNLAATDAAKLMLSSQLLRVAVRVDR